MIVTVADESDYLINVTKYMVLSLARVMPNEKLFVVIVNGIGKYDDEIEKWHPNISILHYEFKLKQREKIYFCFMALPLYELLGKYDEPLIYLDGDIIVNKSLKPLFDELNDYDLLVRYRPLIDFQGPMGTKYGGRVNSGVLALANTPQTLNFTLEFKEKIISLIEGGNEVTSWNEEKTVLTGIDQELLWVLIMEYTDKLRFFPLNDKYNDSYFKSDSTIWHAKGVARNNSKYLMECHRLDYNYRDFINDKINVIYKSLKDVVKKFLVEPNSDFRIKELADVISSGNSDSIVLLNSSFYIENKRVFENKKVTCYDIDPVVYYNNKNALLNVHHYFIVSDNESLDRSDEVDLLIYEEEFEHIVANIKAKNMVVKSEKI